MRLHPTVPHMPGEAPTSFASRLARRNGVATARELISDLGLDFRKLGDGDPDTTARLAEIAGTAVAPLLGETCRRQGGHFRLRGQLLIKSTLVWKNVRLCPACLEEDRQAAGNDLPGDVAGYCRTSWTVVHIRTCSRHGLALIDLPASSRMAAHDFSSIVADRLGRRNAGMTELRGRPVSAFETYLLDRLDGGMAECWLDGLPFYAAAKACEMLGAAQAFGRMPNLRRLTGADWARAGEEGFAIASGGPKRIDDFFGSLWSTYPGDRATPVGPQAWFGRVYQWLEYRATDPAYEPIRELVARSVADRAPFHHNERMFGRPMPYRKVHSLGTAAHETKIGPKRLRAALDHAGHLDPAHAGRPDHEVTFDAPAASELLARLSTSLTMQNVASALGITWTQTRDLVHAGHLRPMDRRESGTKILYFASDDVDAFISALRFEAKTVAVPPEGAHDPGTCCYRAHCSMHDVVGLILRRELSWVGRLPDALGVRSVLVDVEEVCRRLRRADLVGFMRYQVGLEMSVPPRTVNALIDGGILATTVQRHPVVPRDVYVVSKEEFDRFRTRYAKISDVAEILGLSMPAARRVLDAESIGPVLSKADFLTAFYSRVHVEALAARRSNNKGAVSR